MKLSRLPLLCRSGLRPGESLQSLLVRLSEENHYPSTRTVAQICQERLTQPDRIDRPRHAQTYTQLSALVGIPADRLYNSTVHVFARTITPPDSVFEKTRLSTAEIVPLLVRGVASRHILPDDNVRYCPHCLGESPYHRLAWAVCATTACLRHQCLLIQRCPSCSQSISVRDLIKVACPRCGFTLTQANAQSVAHDSFGMLSQATIQHWLGVAPPPNLDSYSLPHQSPPVMYRLIDGLCKVVLHVTTPWPFMHKMSCEDSLTHINRLKSHRSLLSPVHAYTFYATGFKALVNWSSGFYELLQAYRERQQKTSKGSLHQDFGLLYASWLERNWRMPQFQFIQDAFEQFVAENYSLTRPILCSRRYKRSPTFAKRFPRIKKAQAAQILQTSTRIVDRLIRFGFLNACNDRLLDTRQVKKVRQRWQNAIPLDDVTRLLGLSEGLVLDLVDTGILSTSNVQNTNEGNAWVLNLEPVYDLLENLHRVVGYNGKSVSLTRAAQGLSEHGYDVAAVIGLILDGEVRGCWGTDDNHRLDTLRVAADDVQLVIDGLEVPGQGILTNYGTRPPLGHFH
jgi:hypothetical protein